MLARRLTPEDLDVLVDLAVRAELDARRKALWRGMETRLATAPGGDDRSARRVIADDLDWLDRQGPTRDVSDPLALWLANAVRESDGKLSDALEAHRERIVALHQVPLPGQPLAVDLKGRPPTPRPWPYPLLAPYEDPAEFGGRDAELDPTNARSLISAVNRVDRMITGVFAPSGFGKSSLLQAGLAPQLRREGVPVAIVRWPQRPRLGAAIVRRLFRGALETVADLPSDDAPRAAIAWLRRAADATAATRPPVVVLDQLEEIFKAAEPQPRARVGRLLAEIVAEIHEADAPLVRVVLAYREEYHGKVCAWLGDVTPHIALVFGDAVANALPRDLRAHVFHDWPLPPLGARAAEAAFLCAIQRPLEAHDHTFAFDGDGDVRLAQAFARTRAARPSAPLVPELQVVLRHLLEAAGEDLRLRVPDPADGLIADAISDHVRAQIHRAAAEGPEHRSLARTRILLGLARLCTGDGEADPAGAPLAALSGTIDSKTIDLLAGDEARVIVLRFDAEGREVATLGHDVVARAVWDDARAGGGGEFDADTLELDRLVDERARAYHGVPDDGLLALPDATRHRVEALPWLVWGARREAWWAAVARRGRDRIEASSRRFLAADDPDWQLVYLQELLDRGAPDDLVAALIDEKRPWDAAIGQPSVEVADARARLLDALTPLAAEAEQFGKLIAGIGLSEGAAAPRLEALHAALSRVFSGRPSDVDWVAVAGGTFEMGDERNAIERPIHAVRVTGFELSRAPVTRAEYARFDSEGQRANEAGIGGLVGLIEALKRDGVDVGRLPAMAINWFEAQAFAVWVDATARLLSEAEWEYAARGGVEAPAKRTQYWTGDADAAVRDVAWIRDNSGAGGYTSAPHEVGRPPKSGAPSHPLGLWDVMGNVYEWTLDTFSDQGYVVAADGAPRVDPVVRRRGSQRVMRGGSFLSGVVDCRSANRYRSTPGTRNPYLGFRVARPAPELGLGS